MAFVYKQKRGKSPIRETYPDINSMSTNQFSNFKKNLQKLFYNPVTQNIQAQVYKKKFTLKEKINTGQENLEEVFDLNKAKLHDIFRGRSLITHPKIIKYNLLSKYKKVQIQRPQQQLGPGSYNLPSCLNNNSIVKYLTKKQKKQKQNLGIQCQKNRKQQVPGPFSYQPKNNQKIKGDVKYHNDTTVSLKQQDYTSINPLEEEKHIQIHYNKMKSYQFKTPTSSSNHYRDLLNIVIKNADKYQFRGLSQEEEQVNSNTNRTPGPGHYDISQRYVKDNKIKRNVGNNFHIHRLSPKNHTKTIQKIQQRQPNYLHQSIAWQTKSYNKNFNKNYCKCNNPIQQLKLR